MIERVTRYSGWLFGAAALTLGSSVMVRAQGGQRDVWSGVYTAEQSARGKVAYAENCAACHGDTLAGIDVAPALAGGGFLNNWTGTSAGDLFSRIKTTMPLSAPGSLSGKTVADIEAYMFEVNGFPAGKLPLPPSQPMAAGIMIAPKPVG